MNKNLINEQIGTAYEAIKSVGISKDGVVVEKAFRGQISSFGAAITMGSTEAAIAFFSDDGSAAVKRSKLIEAIVEIIEKRDPKLQNIEAKNSNMRLLQYAGKYGTEAKENILNAAIAIKLAMNLFELK